MKIDEQMVFGLENLCYCGLKFLGDNSIAYNELGISFPSDLSLQLLAVPFALMGMAYMHNFLWIRVLCFRCVSDTNVDTL